MVFEYLFVNLNTNRQKNLVFRAFRLQIQTRVYCFYLKIGYFTLCTYKTEKLGDNWLRKIPIEINKIIDKNKTIALK